MAKQQGTKQVKGQTLTAWQRVRSWYRSAKGYLDSPGILPWILNILLAFLIIKFVVFPALSLIFGSALPVVAVMSGSMEHRAGADGVVCGRVVGESYSGSLDAYWNTCGGWYEERGIDFATFSSFPLKRGFNKGDIMVILGPSRGVIEVGDTIVFQSREPYPIIHRVIAVTETAAGPVYSTKGDHNPIQIVTYILDETAVPHDAVIGRAIVRIPWLGWIKIWFSDAVNAILR